MNKIQADTPLGSLLTQRRLPEDYHGESVLDTRFIPGNYNLFDIFSYVISDFVLKNRKIDPDFYFTLYFECEERLRQAPRRNVRKSRCFYYLNKLPWDFILTHPSQAKEYVKAINKIEKILFSVRARGSVKWKHLDDVGLKFVTTVRPGKTKKDFPEPRYIGVGYRDKGSSRVPSLDGQPSWQTLSWADHVKDRLVDQRVSKPLRDRHLLKLQKDQMILEMDKYERKRRLFKKNRDEIPEIPEDGGASFEEFMKLVIAKRTSGELKISKNPIDVLLS